MLSERLLSTVMRQCTQSYLQLKPLAEGETHMPEPVPGQRYMLYMHVPFCERLCPYCSFNRFPFKEDRARPYFANMRKEMRMLKELGYDFDSVYIGGGTPTILLDELCETIDMARDLFSVREVSSETNPNHLIPSYLEKLQGRVQRLSVGVQSFDDGLLKQMDRYDKYGCGQEILERIQEASPYFTSMNADMIFNFPAQTEDILIRDIEMVVASGASQTTFYPLMASPSVERSLARTVGKVDYEREQRFYEIICELLTGEIPGTPEALLPAGKQGERGLFEHGSAWTFNRRVPLACRPAERADAAASPGRGLRLPDGSRNELDAAASPGTASPRVPGGSRTEVRFAPANPRMCGTGETLADSLGRTCEGVAPTAREGAVSTAREGAAGVAGNVLDMPAHLWDEARGVFAGDAVYLGQISYEHRLSNKELVLTGLSNNTAFILVVLGVLAALVQVVGELAPLLFGDLAPVMNYAFSWGMDTFGGGLVAALAVGVVGVMVLVWTLSAVGSCISYGGFRCCRRGSRIEVERGLLQHRFQGVNVDRVQSVIVKQSFVRRLLGYCEVSLGKIDAAQEGTNGQQGASLQQGLIIHPFVKLDRVPEILAGVIPEFSDVPVDVRPVAPVALRRAIVRRAVLQGGGFWLAVCTALVHIPLNLALASVPSAAASPEALFASSVLGVTATILYVLAVVLFALDVVGAVLWHRDSGFAFNRAFMQVSNGGFSRETVSFPRKKIQFGYTRVNPFQRRARTATLNARTAAGVGGTTVRLIDVREEDAAAWLSWLKPHGNVVE